MRQLSTIIERRRPIAQVAAVLAVMFGLGVVVAIGYGAVPTWQNHGSEAGPGLVHRSENPELFYGLTAMYGLTAAASLFLTFYRFPWITLRYVRLALLVMFLLLFIRLLTLMLRT